MKGMKFKIDYDQCKQTPTSVGWGYIEIIERYLTSIDVRTDDANVTRNFYNYSFMCKATGLDDIDVVSILEDEFLEELAHGNYKLCSEKSK